MNASADGFVHILMQKRNEREIMVKAETENREGVITSDTDWVIIQVGSAALKAAWQNYSESSWRRPVSCGVWRRWPTT